jgi:glucose-6-phosphate 1-epimerase
MEGRMTIADLDRQFGIAGVASVLPGNGGLPKVVIATPRVHSEMYLHGAQVTSWVPADFGEVLYLSPNSVWQDGRAIRGGIPICFPWFGNKKDAPAAPAHGFVRTAPWELKAISASGDDVTVSMSLDNREGSSAAWSSAFHVACHVTFGSQLTQQLIVTNTGSASLQFEEALHTYFLVGQAESAYVQGLDGTDFLDKTDNYAQKRQAGDIRFVSETDRIYLDTQQGVTLIDPAIMRRITLSKKNSSTTVVWNPWDKGAQSLSDLGEGQWKRMVCIETSNVGRYAIQIAPGETHTMTATVRVTAM